MITIFVTLMVWLIRLCMTSLLLRDTTSTTPYAAKVMSRKRLQAVLYSLLKDLWHTLQINIWLPMWHYTHYLYEDPTAFGWNIATVIRMTEVIAIAVRLLHLFLLLYTCLQ